jgi:hypothetical protein
MPLFPAAKLMDNVIGVDFHTTMVPPSPIPVPMLPHPYFGVLMLWSTPQFPVFSGGMVLINSMPACTVGAMGYSVHIPQLLPAPPTFTNLLSYWRHHLVQVPKALVLVALTLMANIAIAGIASIIIPSGSGSAAFMKQVTGIDASSRESAWESIKGSFDSYRKWQTWVHLLLPPLPYPGSQGSTSMGSPNVTVNGGPLAFSCPLVGASCSEIPFVPNANVLGFSNVMVGVSLSAFIAHALQIGISAAVAGAAGKKGCGCSE